MKSLKRVAHVPLDVHLMITDPDRYIDAFAEAGAAMISVHVEVLPHLHRTVHAIKALGVKAGVVLNPGHAGRRARGDRRRRRLRARDVGQPGLRRPDFHPAQRVEGQGGARAARSRRQTAAPIEIDGGIDLATVAARRRRRRADPRRRARRSSTRPIPSARRASSRRGDAGARGGAGPVSVSTCRHPRPRALRRNRSDGRRLLRELLRLVRGRPHRSAAR